MTTPQNRTLQDAQQELAQVVYEAGMYSLEIKQMQHDMEKLALEVTTRHDLAQDLKKEVDHLRNQIKAELNEVINNATT